MHEAHQLDYVCFLVRLHQRRDHHVFDSLSRLMPRTVNVIAPLRCCCFVHRSEEGALHHVDMLRLDTILRISCAQASEKRRDRFEITETTYYVADGLHDNIGLLSVRCSADKALLIPWAPYMSSQDERYASRTQDELANIQNANTCPSRLSQDCCDFRQAKQLCEKFDGDGLQILLHCSPRLLHLQRGGQMRLLYARQRQGFLDCPNGLDGLLKLGALLQSTQRGFPGVS
jgi:hypothetical protein